MSVEVPAPMAGNVWKVLVKVGDDVQEDDELMILEAMKMEIPVYAPQDGKVAELKVAEQDKVEANDVLVVLE